MKNKKLIALVAAGVLVVGGIAGGTLAYFTDSKDASNVITMGEVTIDLTEPSFPDDKIIENVKPNQKIAKDPTITLGEDSNSAYVRATITMEGLDAKQQEEMLANIEINVGWYHNPTDGYYYFNTALTKENPKVVLFNEVTIPETWGNELSKRTFKINVNAEAIQADNFTPTFDGDYITGWYYTNGEAITSK